MRSGAKVNVAVAAMRLEPLLFAGYERLDSAGGFVRLSTPQGGWVHLQPSHPSFQLAPPQPTDLPPPPPREPLGGELSQSTSAPTADPAEAKRALADAAAPHTSTAASAMLPPPPDGFEVEFLSSSSAESSVAPSHATSRGASPPPEATAPEDGGVGDAPANTSSAGDGQPSVLNKSADALERGTSEKKPTLHMLVHGAELVASAASLVELDEALAQCALVLFGGKLPYSTLPLPGQAEAHPQWPEAANYHRAVLLGFDDAGLVYLDAQAFAQRLSPPQEWRLCPLPLLVCGVAELAHYYRVAESADTASERSTATDTSDSVPRYPVLPRPARTATAGGSEGLENTRPSQNGCARSCLAPPLQPTPVLGEAFPLTTSTTAPPAPPAASLAYLSPPLRWSLPACGRTPMLDLRQLFQVQPDCVYGLARPPEEVIFLGVAFGVPWIRPVTLASTAASGTTPSPVATHCGATLHAVAPSASSSASQPPAGYRWKDVRAWAEPLVGCHDAFDIRGRHGLTGPTAAAAEVPSTAVVAAKGSASRSVPPKEAVREPSPPSEATGTKGQRAAALTPSPKKRIAAAPLFVKEGHSVFVPGRFGVMLECSTNPALMAAHFGVLHGDRVVARALSPHGAAAQLSGTPNRDATMALSLPPGPMMVMGLHGRNVLVLLGDGEGQVAVQIHITHGISEVAETFRKVSGTPLPPPALPLQPLSTPASPPDSTTVSGAAATSHRVAEGGNFLERQPLPDTEEGEGHADTMLSASTCVSAELADAAVTPAAASTPSQAQSGMSAAAGTQGGEVVSEDAGVAAPMADGDRCEVPLPAKTAALADLTQAASAAAPFSSTGFVRALEVTPKFVNSTPHTGRWSSTTPSSASATSSDSETPGRFRQQQRTQCKQTAEESGNHSGLSMAKVRASTTPMQDAVAEAAAALPASAAQLLQSADEVTIVPAATPTEDDAPSLLEMRAIGHATVSPSREVLVEAEVVEFAAKAASTNPPRARQMGFHAHDVAPLGARSHEFPLLQLPERHLSALEDLTGQHPPPGSSLSAPPLSTIRTPSVRRTPSSSMPPSSHWQHAGEAPEATQGVEARARDVAGDSFRLGAGRAGEYQEQAQHVRGVPADGGGALGAALDTPSLSVPPQQQLWANQAPPSSHAVMESSEDGAAPTASEHLPQSPEATTPRSYHAEEVPACCAAPPAPSTATPAITFAPSYSPLPARFAEYGAPARVGTEEGVSSSTLASAPCAAAVGLQHCSTATASKTANTVVSTPFTNFLKAYAIRVLDTHGEVGGSESGQLRNGTATSMRGYAAKTGEPLQGGEELAWVLGFYREKPLARIMEATAAQRRCCAAWKAAVTFNTASAASPSANDMLVRKLKASASTTVFEELRVEELVSLLSILQNPPSVREGRTPG
ncbi:hypothetical protein LSCM1_06582 [Leishmania martiniquensis]|uniref:Uncharacterized protein n=1 Tax=Leishmania martiniquensis TaxID=1580590 RepID=A0A836KVV9_9TRYP|nr:hypothetical protein LSCM1_06582 [Leishmania martiniquensis]